MIMQDQVTPQQRMALTPAQATRQRISADNQSNLAHNWQSQGEHGSDGNMNLSRYSPKTVLEVIQVALFVVVIVAVAGYLGRAFV